jgi:hypothetical protein
MSKLWWILLGSLLDREILNQAHRPALKAFCLLQPYIPFSHRRESGIKMLEREGEGEKGGEEEKEGGRENERETDRMRESL